MPITNITAEDYLASQMLHTELTWRQSILFSCLILLAFISYLWFPFPQAKDLVVWVFGGAAVGGVVGRLIARTLLLPRRARRIYAQQKGLHGQIEYTWDAEAFSVKTERGQARTPWRDYVKYRESETLFLLYHSDIMFNMVPKRLFVDPAQAKEFRSHLSAIRPA